MKKKLMICALALSLCVGMVRPASAIFDKTRFVAHMGAAFFAFHHWVWKPYKNGEFAPGAPHRTKALLKGGAALLFAVHEVKVSEDIAHKSDSPLLHKLVAPMDSLAAEYSNIGNKLKGGHFDPHDLDKMNGDVDHFGQQSAAAGAAIQDKETDIKETH